MAMAFSLTSIFLRYKWRIAITLALVVIEAILGILYPLMIGFAINELLAQSYQGIYGLALLGAASLTIGTLRRFYDTRVYSGIYLKTVSKMVSREQARNKPVSTISARANLMTEFVEFLENAMPDIVESVIATLGVLIIIATLNLYVFAACLALLLLMAIIYWLSGSKNYRLNKAYNDEFEQQVSTIASGSKQKNYRHFKALMRWNIALSDLETLNYFLVWAGVIALFIYTPIQVISDGVLNYGLVFAALMYVFDFIERLVTMPLHIQQAIRLHEISRRLQRD